MLSDLKTSNTNKALDKKPFLRAVKCQGSRELHHARKLDGVPFEELHIPAAKAHGDKDTATVSAPKYSKFSSLAL